MVREKRVCKEMKGGLGSKRKERAGWECVLRSGGQTVAVRGVTEQR